MPASSPPSGNSYHDDGRSIGHEPVVAALRAAFARLQPQGGDAWNFLAAFTHLGNRYGPYQPGASDLSKLVEQAAGTAETRQRRIRRRAAGAPGAGPSELEQAMAQVVEAFRFLAARVRALEARAALQERPVDGAAWLMPALELGRWVEPVASHIVAATPGGEVVHGDSGEGALLDALGRAGVRASGAEPRGTVALGALERGHSVTVAETADELSARASASLGGVVLSGVVDRIPLHSLVALLAQARRTLTSGAPLVVVARGSAEADAPLDVVAQDLLATGSLHARTWKVLLERAGFVHVAPLSEEAGEADEARIVLSASVPR